MAAIQLLFSLNWLVEDRTPDWLKAYRLTCPIRTPTLTQTTDIILTQWSAATGVKPAHLNPTLPCGPLMLFITVTEGHWGCG